jgi:hypothetical protein
LETGSAGTSPGKRAGRARRARSGSSRGAPRWLSVAAADLCCSDGGRRAVTNENKIKISWSKE